MWCGRWCGEHPFRRRSHGISGGVARVSSALWIVVFHGSVRRRYIWVLSSLFCCAQQGPASEWQPKFDLGAWSILRERKSDRNMYCHSATTVTVPVLYLLEGKVVLWSAQTKGSRPKKKISSRCRAAAGYPLGAGRLCGSGPMNLATGQRAAFWNR